LGVVALFVGPLPEGNFLAGRAGHTLEFGGAARPAFVVLHSTAGTLGATDRRFADASRHGSAHYGVGLDGSMLQWVDESDTAFHTGRLPIDLVSIGIEHEDGGDQWSPRTAALYQASSRLVRAICLRYRIPISRRWVLGHSELGGAGGDCPGSLDVDRIVAMASGTWQPGSTPPPDPPAVSNGTPEDDPAAAAGEAGAEAVAAAAAGDPGAAQPAPVSTPPDPTGDPLRDIAAAIYRDPNRWPEIYGAIDGVIAGSPALTLLRKMVSAQATVGEPAADGGPPAAAVQVQALPSTQPEKLWGGSRGAVFAVQIVYLLLLGGLAAVFFTNRSLIGLPEMLGPISIAVPWFGALGAVLISLVGVTEHRRDWDPTYRFWHWSRPLLGASFGSISVLIFQAGILAVGTAPAATPSNVPKNLLFYLTAFVVGYREETFRDLIKRLSDVIFAPGGVAGGLALTSMSPDTGPAAGGTSVAILGTSLDDTDAVRFGTTPAHFHVDGDTQVTVTSPPGQAGAKVNVVLATKSASAIAGTFSYS
jgi:N-acetylmuramoyl-L-alanine amidase/IPT/TIG domain